MYKLYVSIAGYTFVDASHNELDIINTICEYFKDKCGYRFIVLKSDGEKDELYQFIKDEQDLKNYIADYNKRDLESSSVTKLKREILDLSDKSKKKKR